MEGYLSVRLSSLKCKNLPVYIKTDRQIQYHSFSIILSVLLVCKIYFFWSVKCSFLDVYILHFKKWTSLHLLKCKIYTSRIYAGSRGVFAKIRVFFPLSAPTIYRKKPEKSPSKKPGTPELLPSRITIFFQAQNKIVSKWGTIKESPEYGTSKTKNRESVGGREYWVWRGKARENSNPKKKKSDQNQTCRILLPAGRFWSLLRWSALAEESEKTSRSVMQV